MTLETWFGFVGVTLLFMATPGPSHLLMVSNTLSSGFRKSTATACGDLSANAIQMLAAGLGVSAIVAALPSAMDIVLLAGATYIAWLGFRKLHVQPDVDALSNQRQATTVQLFSQGFMTSMTNPKAIIFFAALFPGFVDPARYALDWSVLSCTYLAIDGSFLMAYGLLAARLARALSARHLLLVERVCGVALIGVALAIVIKTLI
ncbi:MAG: LysE family translocator [Pseudomonadota bacterium]